MILVVDTNRIIAALIKDSVSKKILFSDKFIFLTIGFTKFELNKHKKEILRKTNLTESGLNNLLSILFGNIYVVDDLIIKNKFDKAKRIMDIIDSADTPFIALALSMDNDGIWTDDRHFQKQNKIKVWKTSDLIKYL